MSSYIEVEQGLNSLAYEAQLAFGAICAHRLVRELDTTGEDVRVRAFLQEALKWVWEALAPRGRVIADDLDEWLRRIDEHVAEHDDDDRYGQVAFSAVDAVKRVLEMMREPTRAPQWALVIAVEVTTVNQRRYLEYERLDRDEWDWQLQAIHVLRSLPANASLRPDVFADIREYERGPLAQADEA